ncbi:glycosyltransferase [Ruegeria pomeroyi]|uniref:glycosyltransferase n=1 Tax=Ruegeria pomeroyi TaxID=89184 RepID=UPI001F355CE0|nr:glycosyltransferase [Ruegeria pomeroyi]MCE8509978.1 glycosyltransferase [Ruegeria pomeroyi]
MKIAVLAAQNFNLIDGSSIWLLNTCKLLAMQPDFEIDLLLRHRLENRVLAGELPERIRVCDADTLNAVTGQPGGDIAAAQLPRLLRAWEELHGRYDRFFVRGEAFATCLLDDPSICDRVVVYAPSVIPSVSVPEPDWVQMGRKQRCPVVVQSGIAKSALESLSDYPAHVVHVVPPIVLQEEGAAPGAEATVKPGPVCLCYAGKIELQYGMDWLLDLSRLIGAEPDRRVCLIAGKDTHRRQHPEFFEEVDAFRADVAAGLYPAVSLVSNLPHAEAKALMGQADFAFCLRHDRYDDVVEISTKIVEFCTFGVPPILNDNVLNRTLFGQDYPYLVDTTAPGIPARIREIMGSRDSEAYLLARRRCLEIARDFSADFLSSRLGAAIRGHDRPGAGLSPVPRHILIATHERKFLRQLTDRWRADPDIRLSWENWDSTVQAGMQPQVPEDVDTVFCEWCCENAVWHSRNKRPGTRLIIRLHRFEAFRDFPDRVAWDNVDALIVVSEHFRDILSERCALDPARIHVMPQYIDWHGLQRQKLPEARFTVGLVGINPFEHKRFDRALDFFTALRKRDDRFRLVVRSAMPWEVEWVWNRQDETRERFETQFDRVFSDPALAGAVRFDPAGPDMEEWYRGVGTILSSSDSEGCHTAVLEGMASGCLPVVYDWPGARSLFAPHVHDDLCDAIPGLLAFVEEAGLDARRAALAERVARHDVEPYARQVIAL